MEKNCVIFVIKKLYFVKFFGLYLDLDFPFVEVFGLWLVLEWVLKIQAWIEKYDSPLIPVDQVA